MLLVIDDNRELADLWCECLTREKYEVAAAYSGEEGLILAKERKPRVILCDIRMPGLSGHDVARRLRSDEELKDIYLVAVSGYSSEEDVKRSLQAGFNMHLSKPLKIEVIKELLEGRV